MTLHDLIRRWRAMADGARVVAPAVAEAFERTAAELEACLGEHAEALLPLSVAARESGYSADHLGRLVRLGRLRNHGRAHAPRVRRGDLPAKPARLAS